MRATLGKLGTACVAAALLAGCGGSGTPELMNLRSTAQGPDEFAILPTKTLSMPTDLSALPAPTPGGTNRTDPTPAADAVAALGGNPARLSGGGIAPADGALVAQTGRFGTSGNIRAELAAEDLEFRRKNDGRFFERLFSTNVYFRAYRPMSLNQQAELERWRRLGVPTPAAPPSAAAQRALP